MNQVFAQAVFKHSSSFTLWKHKSGVCNRREICLPLLIFPVTSLGTQYNWAESDWAESDWSEPEWAGLFCRFCIRREICLPFLFFPVSILGSESDWAESDWSEPEWEALFGRFCKIRDNLTWLGLTLPCFLGIFLVTLPFLGAFWAIQCFILEPSVVGAERNKRHLLLSVKLAYYVVFVIWQ